MKPVLPYDVLLQIFRALDPLDNRGREPLRDTPSSLLSVQHSLGATLSLLSRDWRDLGTKYLWSNFVLSFATDKSRKKLVLLIGNEEIARSVRRLYVFADVHDVDRSVGMPVEFLLPSLSNLRAFELATTPSFAVRIFSQLDLLPTRDLCHLRHLVLDTSVAHSSHYHSFILSLLSRLPLLTSLDLSIQLPSSGFIPDPAERSIASRPLRNLETFIYLLSDNSTVPSTLANPFLLSILSLIDPSPLKQLSISSRTLPDSLSSFIVSSASTLSDLNISCDRFTMETQLPLLISTTTFASLRNLVNLEFGILPTWTAPLHFLSTSRLVSDLFSSMSSLPMLRTVSLDFDLDSHESTVRAFLSSKWEQGVFEKLEWNTWTAVTREKVLVTYERRTEGGWTREEEGNSIEIVGGA